MSGFIPTLLSLLVQLQLAGLQKESWGLQMDRAWCRTTFFCGAGGDAAMKPGDDDDQAITAAFGQGDLFREDPEAEEAVVKINKSPAEVQLMMAGGARVVKKPVTRTPDQTRGAHRELLGSCASTVAKTSIELSLPVDRQAGMDAAKIIASRADAQKRAWRARAMERNAKVKQSRVRPHGQKRGPRDDDASCDEIWDDTDAAAATSFCFGPTRMVGCCARAVAKRLDVVPKVLKRSTAGRAGKQPPSSASFEVIRPTVYGKEPQGQQAVSSGAAGGAGDGTSGARAPEGGAATAPELLPTSGSCSSTTSSAGADFTLQQVVEFYMHLVREQEKMARTKIEDGSSAVQIGEGPPFPPAHMNATPVHFHTPSPATRPAEGLLGQPRQGLTNDRRLSSKGLIPTSKQYADNSSILYFETFDHTEEAGTATAHDDDQARVPADQQTDTQVLFDSGPQSSSPTETRANLYESLFQNGKSTLVLEKLSEVIQHEEAKLELSESRKRTKRNTKLLSQQQQQELPAKTAVLTAAAADALPGAPVSRRSQRSQQSTASSSGAGGKDRAQTNLETGAASGVSSSARSSRCFSSEGDDSVTNAPLPNYAPAASTRVPLPPAPLRQDLLFAAPSARGTRHVDSEREWPQGVVSTQLHEGLGDFSSANEEPYPNDVFAARPVGMSPHGRLSLPKRGEQKDSQAAKSRTPSSHGRRARFSPTVTHREDKIIAGTTVVKDTSYVMPEVFRPEGSHLKELLTPRITVAVKYAHDMQKVAVEEGLEQRLQLSLGLDSGHLLNKRSSKKAVIPTFPTGRGAPDENVEKVLKDEHDQAQPKQELPAWLRPGIMIGDGKKNEMTGELYSAYVVHEDIYRPQQDSAAPPPPFIFQDLLNKIQSEEQAAQASSRKFLDVQVFRIPVKKFLRVPEFLSTGSNPGEEEDITRSEDKVEEGGGEQQCQGTAQPFQFHYSSEQSESSGSTSSTSDDDSDSTDGGRKGKGTTAHLVQPRRKSSRSRRSAGAQEVRKRGTTACSSRQRSTTTRGGRSSLRTASSAASGKGTRTSTRRRIKDDRVEYLISVSVVDNRDGNEDSSSEEVSGCSGTSASSGAGTPPRCSAPARQQKILVQTRKSWLRAEVFFQERNYASDGEDTAAQSEMMRHVEMKKTVAFTPLFTSVLETTQPRQKTGRSSSSSSSGSSGSSYSSTDPAAGSCSSSGNDESQSGSDE